MAKKPDPRQDEIILIDPLAQLDEFENGKPVGDSSMIAALNQNFTWKSAFVNCWTGWPNDGKSTFFMFMALVKAYVHNWKWCIWSPEMYNAFLDPSKKLQLSASDLVDELIFMKTGRPPYKHFKPQYGISQLPKDKYMQALEWVQDHFVFVDPKARKYSNLIDVFKYVHEHYGVNGYLMDPFKNLDHTDEGARFDLYLDKVFADIKRFALETNTTVNIVAHPRNDKDPKNPDGSYKVCTQFSLAGGAAWNNNMDGIFSISRPFKHKDPQDPRVVFYNLKQRKQQLVGRVGLYKNIEFDFDSNRYYFNGYEPIEGGWKQPLEQKHEEEARGKRDKKKAKVEPAIDFNETKVIPEAIPSAEDLLGAIPVGEMNGNEHSPAW